MKRGDRGSYYKGRRGALSDLTGCASSITNLYVPHVFLNLLLQLSFTLSTQLPTTRFEMPGKSDRSYKLLTEKLGNCIQHIKSAGFRSFPDFMKQLFIEFPKGRGDPTDGPYQTVVQTLWSFLVWESLKPVLDGMAASEMMGEDDNRDGMVPDYCISPDVEILSGSAFALWYLCC